ncbi:MAG: hypothetical protein JW839_07405 [Candidatus Lokiarchaeota archaeon]|nr:hypothetical protein [Candidatus Lokiarchaeota archaeon]
MAREFKPTRPRAARAGGGPDQASTTYEQKLRQARSWLLQGKVDTARARLSEAKEAAILNHLDRAPLARLEARIALREAEDGIRALVEQRRWSEARELAGTLRGKLAGAGQGTIDGCVACWLEFIGTAELGKRGQPAPYGVKEVKET